MKNLSLRTLLLAAVLGAAHPAFAQAPEKCEPPQTESIPLGQREAMLKQYEQLPHSCLRAIVQLCTEASRTMLLDQGTAAACSFGYEALLSQGFGGDFHALLAWWRSEGQKNGSN